ncbi:MAG TPA: ADP-ribosylglycohydrolase family protein [Oculatellaceae cyanobacterium]
MDNSALGKAPSAAVSGIHSRVAGTIFGAVCANSLGGSGVGLNNKDINATVGLSGLRDFTPGLSRSHLPNHQPGHLLADAYLGLVLGESIVQGGGKLDVDDLKSRFAELLNNETFANASAGVHCISSMRHLIDGVEPSEEDVQASLHVNAASRAFALGCLPGAPITGDPVELAAKQASLTHGDKRAAASAAVIADSINYFVRGGRLDTADQVRDYVHREIETANRFDERFAEAWDDIAPDLDYTRPAEELPYSLVNVQPTVTELVPTAVGIFLIFRHSAEEAICAAARSGGDTDKVAIIVGALSGAYHGLEAIPARWREKIEHKERLEQLCAGINKFWN